MTRRSQVHNSAPNLTAPRSAAEALMLHSTRALLVLTEPAPTRRVRAKRRRRTPGAASSSAAVTSTSVARCEATRRSPRPARVERALLARPSRRAGCQRLVELREVLACLLRSLRLEAFPHPSTRRRDFAQKANRETREQDELEDDENDHHHLVRCVGSIGAE